MSQRKVIPLLSHVFHQVLRERILSSPVESIQQTLEYQLSLVRLSWDEDTRVAFERLLDCQLTGLGQKLWLDLKSGQL